VLITAHKKLKFKYCWIILGLALGYGLLPVTFPEITTNFENPNVLIIERQECGCPCPEGVIKKGTLIFSNDIREKFPDLSERSHEITLTNFPPFNEISNERPETFSFANGNTFKVEGYTVGADTILCQPGNCELVPRFKVERWGLTSYYARFNTFPIPGVLIYLALGILSLPSFLAFIFLSWKQYRSNDRGK
jgi:hypothetical protein